MTQATAGASSSSSAAKANNSSKSTTTTDTYPTLSTIDDVVSLTKSVELDAEADDGSAYVAAVQAKILPSLMKLYHQNKGKGQRVFLQQLQGDVDPLSMLDPGINTLGYTFVLAVRTNFVSTRDEAVCVMPLVATYAQNLMPEQLRGASEVVNSLVDGIVHVAQLANDLVWANPSLLRILDAFRLQEGGVGNLTTIHSTVLYHLLRTAHYQTAVDWILGYDIVSADRQFSPLVYTNVLEYFYYGGLIYTKTQDYERACSMFEQCVCSPAQSVSAIQIDAYKKLILVQLLSQGKTSPLPTYVSQAVSRAIRGRIASLSAYVNLAHTYGDQTHLNLRRAANKGHDDARVTADQALQNVISAEQDVFLRDQNMGLVKRLASVFVRRRLQWLSKLFVRITVGKIADLLNLSPVETASLSELHRRIMNELDAAHSTGWLNATILNADGQPITEATSTELREAVVRFDQPKPDHACLQAAHSLMAVMKEARRWNQMVEDKERALAQSEAFLTRLLHSSRDRFGALGSDDFDDDAFA